MGTSAKSLHWLPVTGNNNFFFPNTYYSLSYLFTKNILIRLMPGTSSSTAELEMMELHIQDN